MKTVKKIMILLLVLAIALGFHGVVKAAAGDSYSVRITPDKQEVSAGETVRLTVTLDNVNIQSGEKGLGSYQGKISYDTNVFELTGVEGAANWDAPAENNGTITAARTDGKAVGGTQRIAVINLKAKSTAKEGETVAKVTNFEASNAVENIPASDAQTSIKIKSTAAVNPNQSNAGTTTDDTTSTTSTTSATSTTGATKTSTSSAAAKSKEATGVLPKTGVSEVMGTAIAVIAMSGVVAFIGYKRTIIK